MSSTSRSLSSSPDVLGPPGDAEYLISSPAKPFAGRQSWMSPAVARRSQTPAKRPRASLSPSKGGHSIRFDDVMLPGSPTMKLDGRQRSLSPEKIQQDGNVSPWRIRVTLEATQDEENQVQASPSPKRRRPSTVTTMIPLKDERSPLIEKTPARRKGRPRKSDTHPPNGSPWPASPGNTPGPNEASAQKRKPGRPRKSTPKPKQQELLIASDAPSPQAQSVAHSSPMDMTADVAVDSRSWIPRHITENDGLDSDSLNADDLPIANLPMPPSVQRERWDEYNGHDYGRATYDTPTIGDAEHHFQDNDQNIHSTPSKMPSPTRDRLASSARSSRLARNTSSPRTYPTPTPTSSLDDEDRTRESPLHEEQEAAHQPTSDFGADPTDYHEEFDSIMESEGFTMVSLDTLPSAKQYGLGSGTRNATDNASKILREREDGRIGDRLKRKLPGINGLRSDSHSSARPSPVAQEPSPASKNNLYPQLNHLNAKPQNSPDTVAYPVIPQMSSPQKPHGYQSDLYAIEEIGSDPDDAEEYGDQAEDVEEDEIQEEEQDEIQEEEQDEMEMLGEDQDNEPVILGSPQLSTKSPLRYSPADLRRARETQWQSERETVSRHAADPRNAERVISIESDRDVSQSQNYDDDAPEDFSQPYAEPAVQEPRSDEGFVDEESFEDEHFDDHPQSYMSKIVSEPFPSLEQDDKLEEELLDEDNESVDIWQQEQDPRSDPEVEPETTSYQSHHQKRDAEQALLDDEEEAEGGFDDIWQQEAREDHSYLSQHSDERVSPSIQENPSPWRRIASSSVHQNNLSSSPAYVTMEHDDTRHLDQTHIRKLRDQQVDLSAILAEEDTPNRARYYNGTSTPRSILRRRPGAPYSPLPQSAMKSASSRKSEKRVRLQPISQSPDPVLSAENESPTGKQSPESAPMSDRIHRNGSLSGSDIQATQSPHEKSMATPDHSRQATVEGEPSSWFKRITSLTPRWLKAPQRSHYDSSDDDSEDEQEQYQSDQDEDLNAGSAPHSRESLVGIDVLSSPSERPPSERRGESAGSPLVNEDDHVPFIEEEQERFADQEEPNDDLAHDPVDFVDENHDKLRRPRPLAVFGYFSDAHYAVLRRIYRMAKRHPDRLPYFDAPGRAEIIGDWIWTSDGHHGVPITEVQFAIIDRFVHELSHADIEYGGSGQIDWTEADLHRRLISVIIGEQIREERRAKTVRGTSVDTWR
ncbi:hypothetical protein N7478_009726 [Penicillium angulare]|uniref:uncharacterized protein n=1 Tax=Penicillium angulare TaxID=116970 RepID=UPI0025401304|nr:uncharacterized protein N7478_009726 [Penicillium angulare]KAJ5266918.1 hypothetical protein N7478_009726 [Penicillium angulare]